MNLIESLEDYYRGLQLESKSYENLALSMPELSALQTYLHKMYLGQPQTDRIENLTINFNSFSVSVVLASDRLMFALRKMSSAERISQLVGYLVDNIKVNKSDDANLLDSVTYPTNIVAIYKTESGYEFSDMGMEGVFEIITKSIVN